MQSTSTATVRKSPEVPLEVRKTLVRLLRQIPSERRSGSEFRWTTRWKAVLLAGIRAGIEMAQRVILNWNLKSKEWTEWAKSLKVRTYRDQLISGEITA